MTSRFSGLGDRARRVREKEHVGKCTDTPLTKKRNTGRVGLKGGSGGR